jgi:hypothetical protein
MVMGEVALAAVPAILTMMLFWTQEWENWETVMSLRPDAIYNYHECQRDYWMG